MTTAIAKEPVTLPTPERITRTLYFVPSFDLRRRKDGKGYHVTLEEHGWRCSNRWCANAYGCMHVSRLVDYLFEQDIIAALPEPIKAAGKADGFRLEDLFDYSSR